MVKSRKKIVLLIVEGITDQISLEVSIQKLISTNQKLEFEVVHGDFTTNEKIPRNRIKAELGKLVIDGKKRKYKPSDYQEVIHIIDLDGVYLEETFIYEDNNLSSIRYLESGVMVKNKQKILQRNDRKKKIIEELVNTKFVYKTISYRLFYFSGNLEHVLHNVFNPTDVQKQELATKFSKEWGEDDDKDASGFVKLMCESEFSSKMNYSGSWDFIQTVKDKILRHTNVDVFVKDFINSKQSI